jgi:hypothetical protein
MEPTDQDPTLTLVPTEAFVVINGERRLVKTFCTAKSIRALALISKVVKGANLPAIGEIFQEGEDGTQIRFVKLVETVLRDIPTLLNEATPQLYMLLGLILTSNEELRRLERGGSQSVDEALLEKGTEIAYAPEGISVVVDLLSVALRQAGLSTVVGKLMPLLGYLQR